eukprot:Hpha_TRINITY_DN16050_c2_g4::TRINITY_DN16050_c2_g4_i1::g.121508::m.121508
MEAGTRAGVLRCEAAMLRLAATCDGECGRCGGGLELVLVCRTAHRTDELSRCVGAALAGSHGPCRRVLVLAFSADASSARLAWIHRGALAGQVPREACVAPAVCAALNAAKPVPASVEDLASAVAARFPNPELLAVGQLHEDGALLLDPDVLASGGDKPQRDNAVVVLGVHEDFYAEVDAVCLALGRRGAVVSPVSLGPVALHSSACVHFVRALHNSGHLATGLCRAVRSRRFRLERLRPVARAHAAHRALPVRARIHYWVRIGGSGVTEDDFRHHPGQGWAYQQCAVAAVWASKSVYDEEDTRISFVLPSGRILTVDRTLLDRMPARSDLVRDDDSPGTQRGECAVRAQCYAPAGASAIPRRIRRCRRG